ncbi:MAG: C45 family autoproteolytic acyltransferase/hydrolase [Hyphomicrobiales bacterium]
MKPFPLIEISGPPFARGRHYGGEARDRIIKSIALYRSRLATIGIADPAPLIERFIPLIEDFGTQYLDEMRGIAAGAGVELDDIVLVNSRTEIVALARLRDAHPDGCTGVVVLAGRTEDGNLIHAQNWDWLAKCIDTAIVLRIKREDGLDILTFTEAGGLARSGLNAAGIAITANYLESDRDYRQSGIPLPLIRRKALEREHLALAMKAVATTPEGLLQQHDAELGRRVRDQLRVCARRVLAIYPVENLLVHANHWQSRVALSKLKDIGLGEAPESFYRDWRVRRLLEGKRRIALDEVKAAHFDGFGSPFAVCRPAFDPGGGNLSATVAMIVMEPGSGFMDIAPMPALNSLFTRYRLEGEPQALN